MNTDKNSYVRMTGSGSTIVGYFYVQKSRTKCKEIIKKNIKTIGVIYLKLYKAFSFVIYEINFGA